MLRFSRYVDYRKFDRSRRTRRCYLTPQTVPSSAQMSNRHVSPALVVDLPVEECHFPSFNGASGWMKSAQNANLKKRMGRVEKVRCILT
jgi:hypothetical protein